MKLKLSRGKQVLLIAVGLVAALVVALIIWEHRTLAAEFVTAKVEPGSIRNTVTATGTLQAVTTVQVGSQISGTISALYADFNSEVRKGQVVAQLDPAVYQAQVAEAQANLAQANANLADAQARELAAKEEIANQHAGVFSANANLAVLKAQRDDAKDFFERQRELASSGIIARSDLDTAQSNYQAAEARYNQADAQVAQARVAEQSATQSGLAEAQAQVKQAQAQIKQNEGALRLAEVSLSYATIRSPIDGVIISRNVDVGQTVAASLQAPVLFIIANDLTRMQAIANIDQADIGVVNPSNRINFTVDAFPGQNFTGEIEQMRLSPQNVQDVVTYNVVIDVANPQLKLKPGMTTNLTITIAERDRVLKIPNAALRFIPQGVTQDQLRALLRGEPGSAGEQRPKPAPSPSSSEAGNGRAIASPTTVVLQAQPRIVWVLGPDHKPQPRKITLGITDGVTTEVAEGSLKEGELVIIGQNTPGVSQPPTVQRPPGFGGQPGVRPR